MAERERALVRIPEVLETLHFFQSILCCSDWVSYGSAFLWHHSRRRWGDTASLLLDEGRSPASPLGPSGGEGLAITAGWGWEFGVFTRPPLKPPGCEHGREASLILSGWSLLGGDVMVTGWCSKSSLFIGPYLHAPAWLRHLITAWWELESRLFTRPLLVGARLQSLLWCLFGAQQSDSKSFLSCSRPLSWSSG